MLHCKCNVKYAVSKYMDFLSFRRFGRIMGMAVAIKGIRMKNVAHCSTCLKYMLCNKICHFYRENRETTMTQLE